MKNVYVVMRNADLIEGRGPMVFDSVWDDRDSAAKHIDDKPGVMGRKQKWSEQKFGDWEIIEAPLQKK